MLRLVPVVLVVVVCGSSAAPVPKARKAKADYFPLAVGNKWVYAHTSEKGGETGRWVCEVTKVDAEGDGQVFSFTSTSKTSDSGMTITQLCAVSADGVDDVRRDGQALKSQGRFVNATMRPGDTWTVKYTTGKRDITCEYTVGNPEEVKVPAGTFAALPVTTVLDSGGAKSTHTDWYAAGIGRVKSKGNGYVSELAEFTPAK